MKSAVYKVLWLVLFCGCASSAPARVQEAPPTRGADASVKTAEQEEDEGSLPAEVMAKLAELDARISNTMSQPAHPKLSPDASVEAVQLRLREMVELDQSLRQPPAAYSSSPLSEPQLQRLMQEIINRMEAVSREHQEELEPFLGARGWPVISTHGQEASQNAWLLVQHADRDRAFQKQVLEEMASLLEAGEVDAQHYAYLWDRVATGEGRPQRYGTQGECVQGAWQPFELESPEEVDRRRGEVGLEPLQGYQRSFEDLCKAMSGG